MAYLKILLSVLAKRCRRAIRIEYYVTQKHSKNDPAELQRNNLIPTCTYMDTNLRPLPEKEIL